MVSVNAPLISETNPLSNQPTTASTISTKCVTLDRDLGLVIDTVKLRIQTQCCDCERPERLSFKGKEGKKNNKKKVQ